MATDIIVVVGKRIFPNPSSGGAELRADDFANEIFLPRLVSTIRQGNEPSGRVAHHIRCTFVAAPYESTVQFAEALRKSMNDSRQVFAPVLFDVDDAEVTRTHLLIDGRIHCDPNLALPPPTELDTAPQPTVYVQCDGSNNDNEDISPQKDFPPLTESFEAARERFVRCFEETSKRCESERQVRQSQQQHPQTRIFLLITCAEAVEAIASAVSSSTEERFTVEKNVDGAFCILFQPLRDCDDVNGPLDAPSTPLRQRSLPVLANSPRPPPGFNYDKASWAFAPSLGYGLNSSVADASPDMFRGTRFVKQDESLAFLEGSPVVEESMVFQESASKPLPLDDALNAAPGDTPERRESPSLSDDTNEKQNEVTQSALPLGEPTKPERVQRRVVSAPRPKDIEGVLSVAATGERTPGKDLTPRFSGVDPPQRHRPRGKPASGVVPTTRAIRHVPEEVSEARIFSWVALDSVPSDDGECLPHAASAEAGPELARPSASTIAESKTHSPSTMDAAVQTTKKRRRRISSEPQHPIRQAPRCQSQDDLFRRLSQPKEASRPSLEDEPAAFNGENHDTALQTKHIQNPTKETKKKSKPRATTPSQKRPEDHPLEKRLSEKRPLEKRGRFLEGRDIHNHLYQDALRHRQLLADRIGQREKERRAQEMDVMRPPTRSLTPDRRLALSNVQGAVARKEAVHKIAAALHADPMSVEAKCLLPPKCDKLPQTEIDKMAHRLFISGKAQRMADAKKKEQQDAAYSFHPQLAKGTVELFGKPESDNDEASARSRSRSKDAAKRLHSDGTRFQRHREDLRQRMMDEEVTALVNARLQNDHHFKERAAVEPSVLDRYRLGLVRSMSPMHSRSPDASLVVPTRRMLFTTQPRRLDPSSGPEQKPRWI